MYTTFIILVLIILAVVFAKMYHTWMAGNPLLFGVLILTVTVAGMLLGNTVFTESFPIPELFKWATVDGMSDGPLGASSGMFITVMVLLAAAASLLFGAIGKYGTKFLQSPYVYIPFVSIIFIVFIGLAAPVGIHFKAMGIDIMTPTKEAAGTVTAAVLKGGAKAIINTAGQLKDVIQDGDSYDPSDFEPAVERYERSNDRLDSKNKKEEDSSKRKPLRRYKSNSGQKGPSGQ